MKKFFLTVLFILGIVLVSKAQDKTATDAETRAKSIIPFEVKVDNKIFRGKATVVMIGAVKDNYILVVIKKSDLRNASTIDFVFKDKNDTKKIIITVPNKTPEIMPHPDANIDLVAIKYHDFLSQFEKLGIANDKVILTPDELEANSKLIRAEVVGFEPAIASKPKK